MAAIVVSMSASVVAHELTLRRIAGSPFQIVEPNEHVPDFCTDATRVSTSVPSGGRTSTWLRTTSRVEFPTMKRPPQELSDKLLALAKEMDDLGGFLSIDEVAKRADVPRATMYYYFAGKDDLLAFYLTAELARVGAVVAEASEGEGTVVDRLQAALAAVLVALAEHPMMCVELPKATSNIADFEEVMSSMERVVLSPLRELLIEGSASGQLNVPDPHTTSFALVGAVHSVAMMTVIQGADDNLNTKAEAVVSQLIGGILPR